MTNQVKPKFNIGDPVALKKKNPSVLEGWIAAVYLLTEELAGKPYFIYHLAAQWPPRTMTRTRGLGHSDLVHYVEPVEKYANLYAGSISYEWHSSHNEAANSARFSRGGRLGTIKGTFCGETLTAVELVAP